MQPSGKCLRRIALAAAMVDKFVETCPERVGSLENSTCFHV
jgi:hypothetical protein